MRSRHQSLGIVLLAAGASLAAAGQPPAGDYLGQAPPGPEPKLFAPGIVSTGMFERDIAITPDGNEIYFTVAGTRYAYSAIVVVRRVKGKWTAPEVAPFSVDAGATNGEPCVAPDGSQLVFLSTRHHDGSTLLAPNDLWVAKRTDDGWAAPVALGPPVNSDGSEYFPSLARDGTLYFTRQAKGERAHFIYRARLVDGRYTEPEKLPAQVNAAPQQFNAFVAPDQSYLIVPMAGRADSLGGTDYYVVFHNPDDTWTEPINLGPRINTEGDNEYSPYVSPDGKYFFFMSSRARPTRELFLGPLTYRDLLRAWGEPGNGSADIYWVDASFITALRPGR